MNRIEIQQLRTLDESDFEALSLRPIQESDTEYIVKWRNSERVQSQFIFREQFTAEMHQNWLFTRVFTGKVIQYIIEIGNDRRPIGSIFIRDIDLKNESGEFGIFIGEEGCQAKGYGTRATRLFVPYCFSLGFNRIFLRVLAENVLAQNCYRKAGFQIEGVAREMVRIEDRPYDVVFMSVLRKDTTNQIPEG